MTMRPSISPFSIWSNIELMSSSLAVTYPRCLDCYLDLTGAGLGYGHFLDA